MNKITRLVIRHNKRLALLVFLIFLIVLAPNEPIQTPIRAHPLVLQFATEKPDAIVSVIVQKTTTDKRIEDLVARLGGVVTKNLSIINAFAAELPAKQVLELGRWNLAGKYFQGQGIAVAVSTTSVQWNSLSRDSLNWDSVYRGE